jgi:hypothetical protein
MRHEPSGPCPSLQPITDGGPCPSCRVVKPLDNFSDRDGAPDGCCATCRRRKSAITRRRRQRTLRQVARRAEASYRALLAEMRGGGGDAA